MNLLSHLSLKKMRLPSNKAKIKGSNWNWGRYLLNQETIPTKTATVTPNNSWFLNEWGEVIGSGNITKAKNSTVGSKIVKSERLEVKSEMMTEYTTRNERVILWRFIRYKETSPGINISSKIGPWYQETPHQETGVPINRDPKNKPKAAGLKMCLFL